ncbi:hypothetical protein BC939DRAFT_459688 [Gamsiella multidivaricata]|uniref:uncharacterized protein n=1 Tax=Gamsiella multidivaricata TaxID=101098 RepID=UPI0022206686|nr:uncharacterized protein BC939DRAFT_459688 [Gamsiella multidivaricata]KAI7819591.1 hypothetical protein BC939DRAFT_459688 [Gamsiella multidivaricata]
MVAITRNLALGLVLSLSLSSSLFLASDAQGSTTSTAIGTSKPTSTATTTGGAANPAPTSTINAPSAFLGVASASNKNFIFYEGGQLNSGTIQYTSELYSLDLTKSWPISSPAWTDLSTPSSGVKGPAVSGHSATMSKDGTTLLVTAPSGNNSPFLYEYNIAAKTWSTVNAPAA